jgi:hypothetical protein
MRDSDEDNLRRILGVVQECMTDTMPGTKRAAQLDINRVTVWRKQNKVVDLAKHTLDLRRKLADTMGGLYLPFRRFLATHEGAADREHVLAVLSGDANPDATTPPDLVALRLKYQAAVCLAEELFATARALHHLAEQLAPEADRAAEEFAELREALEQLKDFALLSQPRISRAAILLGVVLPSEGAEKAA